jgi:hypothetical protein
LVCYQRRYGESFHENQFNFLFLFQQKTNLVTAQHLPHIH